MPSLSSSLAADLALLRSTAPAVDDRGWLPASLHALIAAIFARIFERLEQLLQLWQSGALPLIPQPAHRTPASRSRAPRRRTRRSRARRIGTPSLRRSTTIHTRGKLAASTPTRAPSAPPRHAHDPPRRPKNPIPGGRITAFILLRYQN